MKKYYTNEEKEFDTDGTYMSYYRAMVAGAGLPWGFSCDGKYDYVVNESCDGAVVVAQFDLDGNLIDIFPPDDVNSVDDFIRIVG